MYLSRLFSQTLRDTPSEAETASHQLLLRAGYMRQHAAGIFSLLPLGQRTAAKIEAIIRREMDAIGGQEVSMPVVQPASIWQETGRWYQIDAEMGRFKDRAGRDMALAMTHEEAATDLVRKEIRSYRQLPALIYHIQTKWRDDPRPRAGLIRVREFRMKDSYSLDADWDGLEGQYRAHYQAYFNIYHACGLDVTAVRADTGMMGGKIAHEFMYLNAIGEDTLMLCPACSYKANHQVARFRKAVAEAETLKAVEKVATPGCSTIEDLVNFLGVPKAKTAKAVLMTATLDVKTAEGQPGGTEERFVFAMVRGDMELNETKLANALHARSLRPATEEEIRASGAVPGYASPMGLKDVLVVVDDAAARSPNLVGGANEAGYHLLNTNYGRDYSAGLVEDIAAAREGDPCPECGTALRAVRGVEVGNIFQLGTRYSAAMGATFLDRDGQEKAVVMGSYGIGVGRLLACIAEEHHDEHGLIWPVTVAPYAVHLVLLTGREKSGPQGEIAARLYSELWARGIETLFDDREESPGVKFNDADLIGLPLRLTVSARALKQGGLELKVRGQEERRIVALEDALAVIEAELAGLRAAVESKVRPVEYEA
jgi:prolyl-tRNA synthetase